MLVLGVLLTIALNVAAAFSALSLTLRIPGFERHERWLAASMLWNFLVLVPTHLLGVLNLLYPGNLAVLSVVVSASAFWLSSQGRGARGWRAQAVAVLEEANASWGAVRGVVSGSDGALGAAGALTWALAMAYVLLLVYLYPSESWDGVWYHDTMVGYAIQQHGYGPIDLPTLADPALIQQANGYPRHSEMTGLWFCMFSDRRWLELPNTLAAIPLSLATYAFCRRADAPGRPQRAVALAWATAMLLLPAVRLQLRTTYVDNHFAAMHAAAFYFATHRRQNVHSALIASVAIALTLGLKSMALLSVPPLVLVTVLLLLVGRGTTPWRHIVLAIVTGGLIIGLFGGMTYIWNATRYSNPFFPVAVSLGAKTFPGPVPLGWVDVNRSLDDLIANVTSVPTPGSDYADIKKGGYGPVVPFFLVPLAALAAALASVKLVVGLFTQRLRAFLTPEAGVLFVSAIAGFTLYKSPALWAARYNVHAIIVFIGTTHWLSQQLRARGLSTMLASAALVTHLLVAYWSKPGWQYDTPAITQMLKSSARERAATSLLLVKSTALARDRELGPGDQVVWSDDLPFPSLLWNETFSNRLVYGPSLDANAYLDRAERIGAKWVVVGVGSLAAQRIIERSDRWQLVGGVHAHSQQPCYAYRRLPAKP
jgi:hypothetical protein